MLPAGRARLCIEETGTGDAVVCLHAGVCDRRMWQGQQQALADRWRLVAYDRRGFGGTSYEPERFSHVDDLIAVLDGLGLQRAVLVGCSQGGRISIDTALAHPQRVRALVLVAAAISGAPEGSDEGWSPALRTRIAALEAAEARGDIDAVNELEAQIWLDGPEAAPGRVGGALRELFLSMNGIALRAVSPGEAVAAPSAWERLHELRVPTLVIWGPLDFATLQERMRQVVAQVPGARGEVIASTAHLPNLEQPDRFNALLRGFLSALPD
jgi:pimeloyl-ACP methyl ester carboxylesterase